MKDNEIIKALKCCASVPRRCKECPLLIPGGCGQIDKEELYLELVNRQKAEIERLEGELIVEQTRRKNAVNAYHEAIKDFAERLLDNIPSVNGETTMKCVKLAIKFLVKEMTEENENA